MEAHAKGGFATEDSISRMMPKRRLTITLVGLVGLCCLMQVVLIARATVPGLDAVRFVGIAKSMDQDGLLETVTASSEQPLFPVWVWLVHQGVERMAGQSRSSWATSVQLAAAIPLVLAVVPVYFLSTRLVGPSAALVGTLLFCTLPEVSRLGADGISDSTHLLLFCLALWATVAYLRPGVWIPELVCVDTSPTRKRGKRGVHPSLALRASVTGETCGPSVEEAGSAVRLPDTKAPVPEIGSSWDGGSPSWLLLTGVAAALAVLTRVEGLVLPVALLAALTLLQFRANWRQSWAKMATAIGCLALGAGLVFAPYLIAVGATTPGTALARMLGRHEAAEESRPSETRLATSPLAASVWTAGVEPTSFAPKETTVSLRRRGLIPATTQFLEELADAFGYLPAAFALFGVWRLRSMLVRPVDRFLQVFCVLFSLAVLHFAAREGYLSARHLLPLVVVGIGCAGYGVLETGRWRVSGRGLITWGTVLIISSVCLADSLGVLHANRKGHRLAAEWLARQPYTSGIVLDTRGWTGLYSGRVTYRYDDAQAAFSHPQLAYVVLESRELEYDSSRSQTLRRLLHAAAEPAAVFPALAEPGQHTVEVYRWNAKRFRRWATSQSGRS